MALSLKIRWLALAAALAALAAAWLLSLRADWVEEYYASGLGQRLAGGLARLSSSLPFSLAEVLLGAALLWLLLSAAMLIRRVLRGRNRLRSVLGRWFLTLAASAAGVAAFFYWAWGLNYSRPGMIDRQGWGPFLQAQVEPDESQAELERLCRRLVEAANQARKRSGEPSAGSPLGSAWLERIDRSIEESYPLVARELALAPPWGAPRGEAKPLRISLLLSHLGLGGFYFPWTGEANFNRMAPAIQIPHLIAHEKAHQRGIASEDEANFIGFLACRESSLPFVRYSGLLFAQRRLLGELHRLSPTAARSIAANRSREVQSDIDEANRFWAGFEGPAAQAGRAVNDAYLKLHRVEGGIRSYQLSSRLLIAYSRSRQGRILR